MTVPVIPPTAPVPWGSNVLAALKSALNGSGALVGTTSPALVTPALGAATATSLAVNGATLGGNAFAATGSIAIGGTAFAGGVAGVGTLVAGKNASSQNVLGINGLLEVASNAVFIPNWGYFGFSSSASALDGLETNVDTRLNRDAAGILAQRNGVTAQSKRVYNTYTDASNYERGIFDWQGTANVLTIGTEMGGTGAARNLKFVVGGVSKLDYGITNIGWTTPDALYAKSLTVTQGVGAFRTGLDIGASVNGPVMANTALVTWTTSATSALAAQDTGLSRISAGVIGVGTGAVGSVAGGLQAATLALGGAPIGTNALAVTGTFQQSGGNILLNGGGYLAAQGSIEVWGNINRTGTRYFSSSGASGMGYVGAYSYGLTASDAFSPDTLLVRDAAGILAQRNGVNAQSNRVYNTFTDSSNYERGIFDWQGVANTLRIGTEAGGTGIARDLQFVIGGVNKLSFSNGSGRWNCSGDFYVSGLIKGASLITVAVTYATLPAGPVAGQRAFITDGSVAAAGNFGAIAAGSGANGVPVYHDGTNWRIG